MTWPEGKKFAFTIMDDTDEAQLEHCRPIYDFLNDLGFKTTKTVWPGNKESDDNIRLGATLRDPDYRAWVLDLEQKGFEIGYHQTAATSSLRDSIEEGFKFWMETFMKNPKSFANHSGCEENIYWGVNRLTGLSKQLYRLQSLFSKPYKSSGHNPQSPYFWGDICQQRITYVRNFVYPDINTLKACPLMPYYDPLFPYVNRWFASSEGAVADSFLQTVSEKNQDRLMDEGGACIMYTHLAFGFFDGKKIHPRFVQLMERLAKQPGWFVPVGTLLDYIEGQRGPCTLPDSERRRLEWNWLKHKMRVGRS